MMSIIQLLDHDSRLLAALLVASLWQSSVMTLGTAILIRLLPRMSGRHRFHVWSSVFGFCCLLPVVEVMKWSSQAGGGGAQAVSNLFPMSRAHFVMDHTWGVDCVILWVATSICAIIRLFGGLWNVRNLLRAAAPLSQESEAICLAALRRSNRGRVRLLLSDDIDTPIATGFFRPSIVLPQHLVKSLSATEWEHILLHEAAHLSRRDDWLVFVCRLSLCLFPWNPSLYYVESQLAKAREEACDEIVLEAMPVTSCYAECLTHVAEAVTSRRTTRLVSAFVSRKPHLPERIESILEFHVRDRRFSGGVARASALLAFASFTALSASPTLVGFAPRKYSQNQSVRSGVSGTLTQPQGSPVRPMIAPKLPTSEREIPGITEGPHRPTIVS
jgi:beta-lactamase regulating signal transducer with metallopeptidase domain